MNWRKFAWILTIVGSVLGALEVVVGLAEASSAPQQAAIAAIGVSLAVVPYCFARAIDEISNESNNPLPKKSRDDYQPDVDF